MPPLFCNTILLSTFIHKNKYGSVRKGNFPEENNRPLHIHELLFQNVKSFLSLPTHLDRVYLCVSTMRLCYRVSRRRLVEFWHASSSCNQLIRFVRSLCVLSLSNGKSLVIFDAQLNLGLSGAVLCPTSCLWTDTIPPNFPFYLISLFSRCCRQEAFSR